jgi:glycosyltransferase involved in cell wall biosynthesis
VRIALVVPGGVDPSLEYRVIPALLALIERLARHHELEVFALRQEAEPCSWPLLGAQVHNIGAKRTRLRAFNALRAAHREKRFALIHALWSGASGMVAVGAARFLALPSLVHLTGGEVVSLPEIGYGSAVSLKGRLREQLVLRGASCISATSAPLVAELARLGFTARRVALGVDLRHWPARAPAPRKPGAPARLIHVASLNRVKDQTTLLGAVALLHAAGLAFHLDVVGEDILQGEMQRLATQLGLATQVHFHGFLTQRQLRPLLEAADLMVLASRHEAGPMVVLEAAVAGVPSVGTAVGHLAEWAPQAARVVPAADAQALASAIATVLADEALRLQLARSAQARALAEDADYTARAFGALYAELTSGARAET